MTKQQLRALFLEKRKNLSQAEWIARCEALTENFFSNIDLSGVSVLHCFLPIEKNKEPNTWFIIERLKRDHPNIFIVLPKVDAGTNTMLNYVYSDECTLGISSWGILEPQSGFKVEANQIDMVLVPLLTFDKNGHRVGYGKGFYDVFLADCKPDTRRVGISLFEGVEQIEDVNRFDQPLHCCITPTGIVDFRQTAPAG